MKVFIKFEKCGVESNRAQFLANSILDLNHEIVDKEHVSEADLIIMLTCASNDYAKENNMEMIKDFLSLKKEGSKIVIAGCLAKLKNFSLKDFIAGNFPDNEDIFYIRHDNWVNEILLYLKQEELYKEPLYYLNDDYSANVTIQTGCRNRCTYCKTHFMNFEPKSETLEDVLYNIKMLLENDYHTIALRGHALAQYGIDIDGKSLLGELIKIITEYPSLENLELVNVNPHELDNSTFDIIVKNPKIRRIFSSTQTGSERLLKLMGRGELKDIYKFVEAVYANNSDVFFETELITGFPTETKDDLKDTLKMLRELRLYINRTPIHPYTNNIDTPAAKLPQYSFDECLLRAKALWSKAQENNDIILNGYIGKTFDARFVKKVKNNSLYRLPYHGQVIVPLVEGKQKILLKEYCKEKGMYTGNVV